MTTEASTMGNKQNKFKKLIDFNDYRISYVPAALVDNIVVVVVDIIVHKNL
jgi:hypothetical protein